MSGLRVALVTSRTHGLSSLVLPLLADAPVEAVGVVRAGPPPRRGSTLRRKARKALRIGPLGALNGVRMRRWYGHDLREELGLRPLEEVAAETGVGVTRVPWVGSDEARRALEELACDVALSLGNGYIPARVFEVPRLGMLNVHHELLPEYRGAQSVLWQIHDGSRTSGFTVHAIDRSIDTGKILLREEVPITLRPTLGETVTATVAELYRRSARGLVALLPEVEARLAVADEQGPGRSFTTPSWGAFRRMVRNHRRMWEEERGGA